MMVAKATNGCPMTNTKLWPKEMRIPIPPEFQAM